jgi:hypothetical protein
LAKYFSKIDDTTIGEHARLLNSDEIYYLFEYTSRSNYSFSSTNQLIANLKKKPSLKATAQYKYKGFAIRECAGELAVAISQEWLREATLVPVPPSKTRDHPDYDDRILKLCRSIPVSFKVDVRELVVQTESTDAAHESNERPTVQDLLAIYEIDENLAAPAPTKIAIIDDVLTAGTHYRAMHIRLAQRFPGVPIVGMFIARRIFPQIDLSNFEDL